MGSLIMPSDRSALYAIKPTVKLVPQEGIIPVSHEADSAGPMTKSVLDLANLLDVLVDPTKTTIPEGGFKTAVTGDWGDIRIGVLEPEKWLYPTENVKYVKEATDQMVICPISRYDSIVTHEILVARLRGSLQEAPVCCQSGKANNTDIHRRVDRKWNEKYK